MAQFQKLVLPYSFAALEPYIDQQTMEIHYGKHHQAYTDKLNEALLAYPEFQDLSIEELLKKINTIPEEGRNAIRNNGGGFYNHNLFFSILMINVGEKPVGDLAKEIDDTFGSFTKFKEEFGNAAKTIFGSGWAWLVLDENKKLHVQALPNQENPYSKGHTPIMCLDVWEHAYYLQYQNRRAEYVDNFWNIVNWMKIDDLYVKAMHP